VQRDLREYRHRQWQLRRVRNHLFGWDRLRGRHLYDGLPDGTGRMQRDVREHDDRCEQLWGVWPCLFDRDALRRGHVRVRLDVLSEWVLSERPVRDFYKRSLREWRQHLRELRYRRSDVRQRCLHMPHGHDDVRNNLLCNARLLRKRMPDHAQQWARSKLLRL